MSSSHELRAQVEQIWHAGLASVRPQFLLPRALDELPAEFKSALATAPRILVVGCGKAGASMAEALETSWPELLPKMQGLVNVPAGAVRPLKRIRLHAARPDGVNFPTAEGVAGTNEMLALLASAGQDDVGICLISGGGSALLPAPVEGVTLEDKQRITKLLHSSGATIGEMNAVRKHLSRVKGGRLAEAFRGRALISFIISDVVGDPLDVIASGPTAADPTTFAEALAVLDHFELRSQTPPAVLAHLERGVRGEVPETPKVMRGNAINRIIGSNAIALAAARQKAESLGYRVLDLGPFVEGETQQVAAVIAGLVKNLRQRNEPLAPPVCILIGGETTVTLGSHPGRGGRNQEFVLALLNRLRPNGMTGVAVLSGGTDGEDGPTDAAGAVATTETLAAATRIGLSIPEHLAQHDAYPFFEATGDLLRTGLTHTNVMDLRVILVATAE